MIELDGLFSKNTVAVLNKFEVTLKNPRCTDENEFVE